MGVHLVAAAELLVEVAGEHLHVAGLVDDLGAGVQLGVVPRHGLGDLGGADERALLAVEELRQRPLAVLDAELEPLLVAPLLEHGAVVVVGVEACGDGNLVGRDHLLDVDLGVPWEVGGGVPLAGLGLLVQLAQRRPGEGVVPREDRVRVVLHDVLDLVDIGVGDGQDGLEVVQIGAADDVGRTAEVIGGGHESAPERCAV